MRMRLTHEDETNTNEDQTNTNEDETNTIPQDGSKPEGSRLAGPSTSFDVIGNFWIFLDIQKTNPVHHIWMSSNV